jgi:co-chaperonin GroES (HSP10)
MKYKACGHYLIIELDKVDEELKSKGGIVLGVGSDAMKREQKGMILSLGVKRVTK